MKAKLLFFVAVIMLYSCDGSSSGGVGWKGAGGGYTKPQNFLNSNEEDTMMTRILKEGAERNARKKTKDSLEKANRVQDSLKNLKK